MNQHRYDRNIHGAASPAGQRAGPRAPDADNNAGLPGAELDVQRVRVVAGRHPGGLPAGPGDRQGHRRGPGRLGAAIRAGHLLRQVQALRGPVRGQRDREGSDRLGRPDRGQDTPFDR